MLEVVCFDFLFAYDLKKNIGLRAKCLYSDSFTCREQGREGRETHTERKMVDR